VNNGLIFDIRRFTVHDGPGIRSTVFFKGCPLKCWWCHNPESRNCYPEESVKTVKLEGRSFSRKELTGELMSVEDVMTVILKDKVFYQESSGGVTFSGGEPLLQPGFLHDLLTACKAEGLHTTVDTSGYATQEIIEKIYPLTDLFLYDLKLIEDAEHLKYTGVSNKLILKNLLFLIRQRINTIIRVPVVPGITDTRKNIEGIKNFLCLLTKDCQPGYLLNVNLLPYHSIANNKYKRFHLGNKMTGIKEIKKETLIPLKEEFEKEGFIVKIGG
jgi:pyruvate formate lyase activating enzyme